MNGAYKLATLDRPFYRVLGQAPISSSKTELRYNINESIDGSVFDRWRADGKYRPQNLVRWGRDYGVDPAKVPGAVMANDPSTLV